MTTSYLLTDQTQAWQKTLDTCINALPTHIKQRFGDTSSQALGSNLPFFAVIVIEPATDTPITLDDWTANNPHWQATAIADTPSLPTHTISTPKSVMSVSAQYHLLSPKDSCTTAFDDAFDAKKALSDIKAQLPKHFKHTQAQWHILPIKSVIGEHRLACFDMDSTLIEQEVIVELAKFCGIQQQVFEITEQAMRGEMDFATSFAKRVALLAGTDADVVNQITNHHLSLQSGAMVSLSGLKKLGFHTVLVSGGFEPFAKHIAGTLGMDEYHANPLDIQDGKLTGNTGSFILDGNQKAIITEQTATKLGITPDQAICIGDGANDLAMMAISDIGIAYHAKPVVQAQADTAITLTGLEGVLYALGHRLTPID